MRRWVLAVLAGSVSPAALADSIWDRRDPRYAFLFMDNRARRVGDVLTVTISEATTANNQDARALSKTSSASAQVAAYGFGSTTAAPSVPGAGTGGGGTTTGTTSASGFFFPLPSGTASRSFNGTSSLTTNQAFTDTMAVTVVDQMPNGNLVIEGYRSTVVAGEERVLRVTGVVRQQDIAFPNAVSSLAIANLKISYLGRGPQSRNANQGFVGRFLNLVWPF